MYPEAATNRAFSLIVQHNGTANPFTPKFEKYILLTF